MTVTRLAAVGGTGLGQEDSKGGLAHAPSNLARVELHLPREAAAALPATECGRRWRTWPGSTCRWGSQTWGG